LPFAEAMVEIGVDESGSSHIPTDDRKKFAAERRHPKVAKWRCRPTADRRAEPFDGQQYAAVEVCS
jgi:hypothetical protein